MPIDGCMCPVIEPELIIDQEITVNVELMDENERFQLNNRRKET